VEETIRDKCVVLAWALWRGMDSDYKRKYARVIWDQFQVRIAGEAQTTNSLSKYVNQLCSKLGVGQLGDGDELAELDAILNCGQDRAILRAMREDTALIVLKVRLLNEERKEEREQRYQLWLEEQGIGEDIQDAE